MHDPTTLPDAGPGNKFAHSASVFQTRVLQKLGKVLLRVENTSTLTNHSSRSRSITRPSSAPSMTGCASIPGTLCLSRCGNVFRDSDSRILFILHSMPVDNAAQAKDFLIAYEEILRTTRRYFSVHKGTFSYHLIRPLSSRRDPLAFISPCLSGLADAQVLHAELIQRFATDVQKEHETLCTSSSFCE